MNCANHPETPAVAYCQFCGKPLCAQCVHKVNDIVSCEPCLAARVAAFSAGTAGRVHFTQGPGYQNIPIDPLDAHPWGTEPWVAFCLGWIPGVGSMYNGQFAKGIAHVLIFVLLIDLAKYNGLIGLLIAAWVFYQVFDAYQTAVARREGLPLPNPLGLNNVGQLFGARLHGPYAGVNPAAPIPPVPPAPPAATESAPASGFVSGYPPSPYPPAGVPSMPPFPPHQYDTPDLWHHRNGPGIPTGAVILIVLGVLFLLSNFGVLSHNWLDHGWPIVLIALGVWIAIRRNQTPPKGGVR
jgi:TM2 domain-containing membrane protein YozV